MARKEKTQIALEYEKARERAYDRVRKAKSRGWAFSDRLYKVLEKKDSPRTRDIERLNALRGERLYKYGTRHVETKPKKTPEEVALSREQRNLSKRIKGLERYGITVSADVKSMVTRTDVTPEQVRTIRGKKLYGGAVFIDPDTAGVIDGEMLYKFMRRGIVQARHYLYHNDITEAFKLLDERLERIAKKEQAGIYIETAERRIKRYVPKIIDLYNQKAAEDPVGFAKRMRENSQVIRENLETLATTYWDDEAAECVSIIVNLIVGEPQDMEEAKEREQYNTETVAKQFKTDAQGFVDYSEVEKSPWEE